MINYSVTSTIDSKAEGDWIAWMKDVHIPDVMATGYFEKFTFQRVISGSRFGDNPTFRVEFWATSAQKLADYREKAAPALIEDHKKHFGGLGQAYREVLSPI